MALFSTVDGQIGWERLLDVAEHEQRVVPEIRHDGDLRKRPDDEHRQSEQECECDEDGDSNGRRQRDRHVRDRGDDENGDEKHDCDDPDHDRGDDSGCDRQQERNHDIRQILFPRGLDRSPEATPRREDAARVCLNHERHDEHGREPRHQRVQDADDENTIGIPTRNAVAGSVGSRPVRIGTMSSASPAGEQRDHRKPDCDPEPEQTEPLPPAPPPVAPERHLSRAERLDQHELHDRSDQREQPAEEDSGGDECDDERHHVDREAERELTVRNVSRWRRRVELCRREARRSRRRTTTSASFSQRRILIGVRNSRVTPNASSTFSTAWRAMSRNTQTR